MPEVPGSRFCKVDLHVHTPASSDFTEQDVTPQDVVARSLEVGLQAIAITDHNSPQWIELVRSAADATDLVVFPGFELNAQGGHILAVFDPSTSIAVVETALIEAGIPKPRWGDNEALGHDILTALHAIARNGGLAIAAHADGPRGFLDALGQGAARIEVYMSPELAAIELVDLERRPDYTAGRVSGYDRAMACIQGSDAHSLSEIGQKPVFLRMHRICQEGLRQALAEPVLRIRFPDENLQPRYPHIESMSVDRGFLAGQDILFNPSLNCLIGGAGSGKSTVIEFLRFGLDQASPVEDIAQDAMGKLRDLAGTGSRVHVGVVLQSGEKFEITREFDDDLNPFMVISLTDGQEISIADIRSLFPIHAYSQGEVVSISRNPLAQLDLIDSHIDIAQYQADIALAYRALIQQIDGLVRLEAITRDRDTIQKEIANSEVQIRLLTAELQSLEQAQKSEVVTSHQYWIAEEAYLRDLLGAFGPTRSAIEEGTQAIELPLLCVPMPTEKTPNCSLLDQCRSAAAEIEQARKDARTLLLQRLSAIEKQVRASHANWETAYSDHRRKYEQYQVEKKSARMAQINSQLGALRRKLQDQNASLKRVDAAERTLHSQLQERSRHLAMIRDRKARISALREKKAKDFMKEIGDTIALTLLPDGNRSQYEELLGQIMKGTYASRSIPEQVAQAIHPTELAALLRSRDFNAIGQRCVIGEKWAQTLIDRAEAHPEYVYQLEATPVEDLLEISFKVAQGEYRTLEKLSTGQKATVIVLLTMVEGNNPIIFDQPEDALYTPFIYTDVVRALRRGKDQRQFILATHNPNIAVGGDADLGIVLEGTSSHASIQAAGGLDDRDTQGLFLWHLEGGEQALRSRHSKFGLK